MTRKRTPLEMRVSHLLSLAMSTDTQEEVRLELAEDGDAFAGAFEFLTAGRNRVAALYAGMCEASDAAETPEKRNHIAQTWHTFNEVGNAVDDHHGDAHAAWVTLFGVETFRHQRRKKEMPERLGTIAHLGRCFEL